MSRPPPSPEPAGRCAACGAPLSPGVRDAPRLVLLCPSCRSPERSGDEAPAFVLPGGSRRFGARWPARRTLRLLLVALAVCIFVIRLLTR